MHYIYVCTIIIRVNTPFAAYVIHNLSVKFLFFLQSTKKHHHVQMLWMYHELYVLAPCHIISGHTPVHTCIGVQLQRNIQNRATKIATDYCIVPWTIFTPNGHMFHQHQIQFSIYIQSTAKDHHAKTKRL